LDKVADILGATYLPSFPVYLSLLCLTFNRA